MGKYFFNESLRVKERKSEIEIKLHFLTGMSNKKILGFKEKG